MANDLHEARKQTKALLAFARAVVAQDEALDNLADIGKQTEAAERDREVALRNKAIAEDEVASAQSLRDAARAELEAASSAIAGKLAEAEGYVRVAKEEAGTFRANAATAAEARVKAGADEAALIIAVANERRAEIDRATAAAQDSLNALNGKIVEADQRLADTNAEIERLRNLFAPKG